MQTAKHYVADVSYRMHRAVVRIPLDPLQTGRALPATSQEITRYVEQLLTAEEQRLCDMATD